MVRKVTQEETRQHLSINQILMAILLLPPDEKELLYNVLPLLTSSNGNGKGHIEPTVLSINSKLYEKSGMLVPFGELSIEDQLEVLNEWVEDIIDIQIYKSMESDIKRRLKGERPEGWVTLDELIAEMDELDEKVPS